MNKGDKVRKKPGKDEGYEGRVGIVEATGHNDYYGYDFVTVRWAWWLTSHDKPEDLEVVDG